MAEQRDPDLRWPRVLASAVVLGASYLLISCDSSASERASEGIAKTEYREEDTAARASR